MQCYCTLKEWDIRKEIRIYNVGAIAGYLLYHGLKDETCREGCGFYIPEDMKYKARNDLDISNYDKNNEVQSCWIEILNDQKPNVIIGAHYRHPKKESDTTFINRLKENLAKLHSNICYDR